MFHRMGNVGVPSHVSRSPVPASGDPARPSAAAGNHSAAATWAARRLAVGTEGPGSFPRQRRTDGTGGAGVGSAIRPSVKGKPNLPTCGNRKLPTPRASRRGLDGLDEAGLELVLQAVGLAPDVQGDRVMEDPIQNGGGDHAVAEDLPPASEALIAGQERARLKRRPTSWKKRLAPWAVDGQVPDLIDDEQTGNGVELELLVQSALGGLPW